MDNLLLDHKRDSCKLNMPDGLKELMSDISREVLRAQPSDIYEFIANYLSALLVTRDNLSIASQVCNHICECDCHPELNRELRKIGVNESNAEKAQDIIMDHINGAKVNECNLMATLMAKTDIESGLYPAIVNAVRAAYLRHQAHIATNNETSSESEKDDVARAISHTLKLYRETGPPEEMYGEMATKIQASYRAYGVSRDTLTKPQYTTTRESFSTSDTDTDEGTIQSRDSSWSECIREFEFTTNMHEKRLNTESSISLAGSHCALPKHKPYSIHEVDCLSLLEETDKEDGRIDYIANTTIASKVNYEVTKHGNKNRRISFVNDSEEEIFDKFKMNKEETYNVLEDDIEDVINVSEHDEEILRVENQFYDKRSDDSEKSTSQGSDNYPKIVNEDLDRTVVKKVDINYINIMSKEIDSDSDDDADTQ